jgi:hypothetical protein
MKVKDRQLLTNDEAIELAIKKFKDIFSENDKTVQKMCFAHTVTTD